MFDDSKDFDGSTVFENMSGQTRSYKWKGGDVIQAMVMTIIDGKANFRMLNSTEGIVLMSGVYMASQIVAIAAVLAILHF